MRIFRKLLLLIIAFLLVYSQDIKNGENIFKTRCAACHKLDAKLIGPPLKGVLERWHNDEAELIKFIKNSQKYIQGDFKYSDYAKKLYEEYNNQQMLPFEDLSDQDIKDVLAYIESGGKVEGEQQQAQQQSGDKDLIAKGEKLFKQNCTACHALDRKVVGPALQGAVDR